MKRTIRGVGKARLQVAGTAITMVSGRHQPIVVVSSYWLADKPGEMNMAGAAAMSPPAALKLARTIRDAAKHALAKARKR